jgi:hypothetical protein
MAKSTAYKQALVAADSGIVIYDTIEILHTDFAAPVRLVKSRSNITATLEATAPEDASTAVTFTAAWFDFNLPSVGPDAVQSLNLAIGNVDKNIHDHLELVKANPVAATVIYRPYVSSDLTAPGIDPPPILELDSAIVTPMVANASAKTHDWLNQKLHTVRYNTDDFPGLRTD